MRWLGALVAVGLLACQSVDTTGCRNPEPGWVEVGVGDLGSGFVAVTDGREIEVALGPQGLHMIMVSARAWSFESSWASATCRVTVAIVHEGTLVGGNVADVAPADTRSDPVEFLGLRAPFTVQEVRPLDGELVEVVVTAKDDCDRNVEGSRTFRLKI